jgi:hypothetical protein
MAIQPTDALFALPADIHARLAEIAAAQGQTPDELAVEMVRVDLANAETDEVPTYNPDDDPPAEFAGAIHLEIPDLGFNHDKYLAQEHGEDHPLEE